MPLLNLQDLKIISPSPDNFILRLTIDGKDYNYIGSGEHIYQDDIDADKKPAIDKTLITNQLAHSSIFEFDEISTNVTAWDIFDINDVGVTTDADDIDNDNLLLLQNSTIDPSAKTAIPMHQINSNSVYGFVSASRKKSTGIPKVDGGIFNLDYYKSDPITRYHYRPMAVSLSSVLGLGTQMDLIDTFDKLFVFDPTDNNRLKFTKNSIKNWRKYQSNRDKSSDRVTNNFDFGKLLVRTVLFPKATLNNEYSTERRYTEISSPYSYMRKYAWDDSHFYSNGSFIVLNSREDNRFENDFDLSARPGTMVTSKYSRRFGDVDPKPNEVSPPNPPEVTIELSNNTVSTIETDYNEVIDEEQELSAINSDIFENKSTFKQYMPESINRKNETTSDTSLMTSKHKANIFDVDIKTFWNKLKQSIGTVPSGVKTNIRDMIRKNLYEMIENIKPAHTKLYKVIMTDDGDDDFGADTSSSYDPTPPVTKTVTLMFKANGGRYNNTMTLVTRSGKIGDPITTVVDPTRLGYLFDSYDKEVPSVFPEKNESYIAQWKPIEYTVVFHSNIKDAGEETYEQKFVYGVKDNLRQNEFENEHFDFIGWSKKPTGAVVYKDNESVLNLASTNNDRIDLYAQWTQELLSVRFNANGGTGSMEDQSFKYGIPQKLQKNKFAYKGYSFIRWIGSNGNEYQDEDEIALVEDIVLSAKWDIAKYYVTFHGNGETSGSMDKQEFIYEEPQELSANKFEKENYVFIEWIGSDDKIYEDHAVVTLSSNLDLYASWQGGNLEIQFHGGHEDVEGSMNSQYANYNDSIVLNPNQFTRRHYEFDKWIDANGNKYDNKQRILNLQNELDLSATWSPTQFEIAFNKNDDSATGQMDPAVFTYGDEYARLPRNKFIKEHYDFINWIDISGFEYENEQELSSYNGDGGELSAQWGLASYYAYFNGNDETSGTMDRQQFIYGEPQQLNPNQFTKDHYSFDGWVDLNGKRYADKAEIELSSNIYLTAAWSRITSIMTFYLYDHAIESTEDDSIMPSPPPPDSAPPDDDQDSDSSSMNASPPQQSNSQITMLYS